VAALVALGWGCKTSSLQTNCFVMDNIEAQLIGHIALFQAIKGNRTKLTQFYSISFHYTLHFAQYLIKIALKKLHEKVAM